MPPICNHVDDDAGDAGDDHNEAGLFLILFIGDSLGGNLRHVPLLALAGFLSILSLSLSSSLYVSLSLSLSLYVSLSLSSG